MRDVHAAIVDVRSDGRPRNVRCPAHEDTTASLSVFRGDDGGVALKCHGGCTKEDVLERAGLANTDLHERSNGARPTKARIVATYRYEDEGRAHLYDVVRLEPKTFRQRRADGAWSLKGVRRVLYRLPDLQGQTVVYVVEGERDVNRLHAIGLPGTTNAGGAGKWQSEFTKQLIAATVEHVVILPDNDEPGRAHAEAVARSCQAAGLRVKVVALLDLPNKGDVSDWLDAGHTKAELIALVEAAPLYEPSAAQPATANTTTEKTHAAKAYTLTETVGVFRRWLYLDDPAPIYAVAAALVANRAAGDPVWLLLVCAPSTGKTEILSAAAGLSWVLPAAKVTEASLLSGTPKRDRAKDATGGLLRQIGEFGVLLIKDFTSVLAQNKDARAEAMAALREVYDGRWDRPVGTDGGRVLSWRGKCGLIGGVTPALDQYGQVTSALGDRFVLLRMPDASVDECGAAALRHGDHERQMRQELQDALAGLVEHAEITGVNRALSDDDRRRLIRLAAYTARARTAVARDGYQQDVLYLPQVEGPGRLVKAYARLLGGLEAIGCDEATAWATVTRIAIDCAPALRTKVIRELVKQPAPVRTSDIAAAIETATKTASRYLEDLSILRLAVHGKQSKADNSPDLWAASDWLREYWPGQSKTDKYPPLSVSQENEATDDDNDAPAGVEPPVLLSPTFEPRERARL